MREGVACWPLDGRGKGWNTSGLIQVGNGLQGPLGALAMKPTKLGEQRVGLKGNAEPGEAELRAPSEYPFHSRWRQVVILTEMEQQ